MAAAPAADAQPEQPTSTPTPLDPDPLPGNPCDSPDRIVRAHAVFDGLYDRNHDAIYAYCCHLTDEHRGADLTQDVFLDAFRALLEDRFDGRNERAWLFTSASRKAFDRRRLGWGRFVYGSLERLFGEFLFNDSDNGARGPSQHRGPAGRGWPAPWAGRTEGQRRAGEAALTAPAHWAEPAAVLDEQLERAAVAATVRRLPPSYRAVLWLREWQDMDYEQISRTLGTSVSSTKSMLWRARNRFREEWRTHQEHEKDMTG